MPDEVTVAVAAGRLITCNREWRKQLDKNERLSLGNTMTEVPGYGRTGFILRELGTSGNVSIRTGRKFKRWNGENSVHRYEQTFQR